MQDLINYINNKKPVMIFGGVEYKINNHYKVTVIIEGLQKELEKRAKIDPDFNQVAEQFAFMEKAIKLTGGEQFWTAVDELELDEMELAKITQLIMLIRSGKTEEEAIAEATKIETEVDKKKE